LREKRQEGCTIDAFVETDENKHLNIVEYLLHNIDI
jgi:hypothetical protein